MSGCVEVIYFPSKIFFRKENIHFSSRRFFICPEIAHDAQSLQVCAESLMSSLKHMSGVTAVRKPEVAGSNRAIDHFLRLFRYSLTRSYFSTKN